jgi:hypothetical protein
LVVASVSVAQTTSQPLSLSTYTMVDALVSPGSTYSAWAISGVGTGGSLADFAAGREPIKANAIAAAAASDVPIQITGASWRLLFPAVDSPASRDGNCADIGAKHFHGVVNPRAQLPAGRTICEMPVESGVLSVGQHAVPLAGEQRFDVAAIHADFGTVSIEDFD